MGLLKNGIFHWRIIRNTSELLEISPYFASSKRDNPPKKGGTKVTKHLRFVGPSRGMSRGMILQTEMSKMFKSKFGGHQAKFGGENPGVNIYWVYFYM